MKQVTQKMQVVDLNGLIETFEKEVKESVKHENPKATSTDIKREIDKKTATKETLKTSREFIHSLMQSSLKKIINDLDSYKVLDQQIKLLRIDARHYPIDSDYHTKLKFLEAAKEEYKNTLKYSTSAEYRRSTLDKVYSSNEMKEFRTKLRNLKSERSNTSPHSLANLIASYRKRLKTTVNNSKSIKLEDSFNIPDQNVQELMFDRNEDNKAVQEKYLELLKYIESIVNVSSNELYDMSTSKILKLLKEENDDLRERRENLDIEIEDEKFKMKLAQSKLANDPVSKMAAELLLEYGKTTEKGSSKAIELLVTSKGSYVLSIANNVSNNFKITDENDKQDIFAEGLMWLSIYANKWKEDQLKSPNIVINFDIYLYKNLAGRMAKMAASLKNLGTKDSTTAIYDMGLEKNTIKNFISDNPELGLGELPYEQVVSIYKAIEEESGTYNRLRDNVTIKRSSDFKKGSSNEDDDYAEDSFNNMFVDPDVKFQSASNMADLIKIFQYLFRINTKDFDSKGNLKTTNKKYFDKYDLIIMQMMLGLIEGPDKVVVGKDAFGDPVWRTGFWKEESMVNYLKNKFGSNEKSKGKFPSSQPSLNLRKKNIRKELERIKKHYPSSREMIDILIRMFTSNEAMIAITHHEDKLEYEMKKLYDELDNNQ